MSAVNLPAMVFEQRAWPDGYLGCMQARWFPPWLGLAAWVATSGAACSPGDNAAPDGAAVGDARLPDASVERWDAEGERIRQPPLPPVPQGVAIDTVVGGHDTYRGQIADVVPLGDAAFVVEYRDANDQVKVVGVDSVGLQGPPQMVAEGGRWVRGDTSEGFSRQDAGCAEMVRVNTMAVEHGVDMARVRLDVHSDCAGAKTMVPVPVGAGVRPSAVTVVDAAGTSARTLVVYGRQSRLVGRFVFHGATGTDAPTVGEEFSIATFTLGSAFSTDVIYNRHSARFIVGFIQRGGFACSTWNVVLDAASDPPAVVDGPTQFGRCDGDQGGHHTSVAYNPRGDGTYAWWRQDMDLGKAVFIHDSSGALTANAGLPTANVVAFGNIWTAPVASSARPELPYLALFGEPEVHLFGLDGAGAWTDRVSRFGPAVQTAVRASPTLVVGLLRVPDDNQYTTSTLRLLTMPLAQLP
jgi:hypothetical protein